jgi:hypothetical protein
MWGRECVCVFPEGAEHPVWVPSWFVKPHGSLGSEDEEAETGRLTPGQGVTKADFSTDQRAAKEMDIGKTDMGQWVTHLGSN